MGILDFITSGLKAIAAACGLASKRSDLNNTAEQQANAEAQQIQADRDNARRDIRNPDQSELNKDVSP